MLVSLLRAQLATALLSSLAKQQASLGLVAFSHLVDTRGET